MSTPKHESGDVIELRELLKDSEISLKVMTKALARERSKSARLQKKLDETIERRNQLARELLQKGSG